MNSKMIVTNLRMKEENWLQVKSVAADMGMSVNEYLNYITQNETSKAMFRKPVKKLRKTKKSIFDALLTLANDKSPNKPMGSSDEDDIIYDIK